MCTSGIKVKWKELSVERSRRRSRNSIELYKVRELSTKNIFPLIHNRSLHVFRQSISWWQWIRLELSHLKNQQLWLRKKAWLLERKFYNFFVSTFFLFVVYSTRKELSFENFLIIKTEKDQHIFWNKIFSLKILFLRKGFSWDTSSKSRS